MHDLQDLYIMEICYTQTMTILPVKMLQKKKEKEADITRLNNTLLIIKILLISRLATKTHRY